MQLTQYITAVGLLALMAGVAVGKGHAGNLNPSHSARTKYPRQQKNHILKLPRPLKLPKIK